MDGVGDPDSLKDRGASPPKKIVKRLILLKFIIVRHRV